MIEHVVCKHPVASLARFSCSVSWTLFRACHILSINPWIVQISPKPFAQQHNLSGWHFWPLPHCFHHQSRLLNCPCMSCHTYKSSIMHQTHCVLTPSPSNLIQYSLHNVVLNVQPLSLPALHILWMMEPIGYGDGDHWYFYREERYCMSWHFGGAFARWMDSTYYWPRPITRFISLFDFHSYHQNHLPSLSPSVFHYPMSLPSPYYYVVAIY